MIRFLIGTILAVVAFWMVLFTVAIFAGVGHHEPKHAPVSQQRRT
jgi:hypothetical protein